VGSRDGRVSRASEQAEVAGPLKLIRAAIRYRDGTVILKDVLHERAKDLRRAGFRAYCIRLAHDNGSQLEADLWSQEPPTVSDYLNAVQLLFDNEPGSLSWEGHPPQASRR